MAAAYSQPCPNACAHCSEHKAQLFGLAVWQTQQTCLPVSARDPCLRSQDAAYRMCGCTCCVQRLLAMLKTQKFGCMRSHMNVMILLTCIGAAVLTTSTKTHSTGHQCMLGRCHIRSTASVTACAKPCLNQSVHFHLFNLVQTGCCRVSDSSRPAVPVLVRQR